MAGSTLGTLFKITTWVESHGKGVGVVIDGCPAGLSLCEADIQKFLDRRKPGQSRYATPRKEDDGVEIFSGVRHIEWILCDLGKIKAPGRYGDRTDGLCVGHKGNAELV